MSIRTTHNKKSQLSYWKQVIFGQRPSNKSISTTHATTKPISSLEWNQAKLDPARWDQVNFDDHHRNEANCNAHTRNTKLLTLTQKQGQFWLPHKKRVNCVLTLKPSQVIFHTQNQFNFHPNVEVMSISIPTLKTSQFSVPTHAKAILVSIQTLNQVKLDPHTKPSQSWPLHLNPVNSDPPNWYHVYFDHPHKTKSILM